MDTQNDKEVELGKEGEKKEAEQQVDTQNDKEVELGKEGEQKEAEQQVLSRRFYIQTVEQPISFGIGRRSIIWEDTEKGTEKDTEKGKKVEQGKPDKEDAGTQNDKELGKEGEKAEQQVLSRRFYIQTVEQPISFGIRSIKN